MGRLYKALAVTAALVSSAASAQDTTDTTATATGTQETETTTMTAATTSSSDRSGLEISVGVGFQAGAGYVYKNGPRADGTRGDVKLSDAANGGVAFMLEAGYRVSPSWFIGAFGQYTHVLTKNNPLSCPDGFDCSTGQIRLGPQVQYHFSPDAGFDPFVGLGFGIVLLNSSIEGSRQVPTPVGAVTADVDIASKTRGPEFVNLTVGGKWRLSDSLSFGPYLTGTYARYTVRAGDQTTTVNLPPAAGGPQTSTAGLPAVDDGPYGLVILGVRGTFNM